MLYPKKIGKNYQNQDKWIDYKLWQLPDFDKELFLRGPKQENLIKNEYITCLGAAQTFGRFVENPYPSLIAKKFNIGVINLGISGAGPSFFSRDPNIIKKINNGKFVIIQAMAARSCSNRYFKSEIGTNSLTRLKDGVKGSSGKFYGDLIIQKDYLLLSEIIYDCKLQWIKDHLYLFSLIKVPIVLLWFSTRSPKKEHKSINSIFNSFPQMVDNDMISILRPNVNKYICYFSQQGLPQNLGESYINRNSNTKGENMTINMNTYYPSPIMHHQVSESIAESIKDFFC